MNCSFDLLKSESSSAESERITDSVRWKNFAVLDVCFCCGGGGEEMFWLFSFSFSTSISVVASEFEVCKACSCI